MAMGKTKILGELIMPSLEDYKARLQKIIEKNKWSKTPNVTLLEAAKKIIDATDKWRRCHTSKEVTKSIIESVFFLLATCAKLEENSFDLDKILTKICKEKKNYSFSEVPDDLIWSFIIYASEPHMPYRFPRETQPRHEYLYG